MHAHAHAQIFELIAQSMQDAEPQLLLVLQQVPHLAQACAKCRGLKQLRSICSETRHYSTGLLTDLTVNLGTPFQTLHTPSLMALISNSTLRRMGVILHLDSPAEQTQP